MNHINIAIDGPAGAGKSTIAKRVAAQLSCIYVDTGAMYRAIALYMLEAGVDVTNEREVDRRLTGVEVHLEYTDGAQQIYLGSKNVSSKVRREEVGEAASVISNYLPVRERLVSMQRDLAAKESVVMDGRDIGTSVLPGARLKVYLTASVAVRAKRRYEELIAKGADADIGKIAADIAARDKRDMTREHSPLKRAADAVLLDSSDMTIEEVSERITTLAREAYKAENSPA